MYQGLSQVFHVEHLHDIRTIKGLFVNRLSALKSLTDFFEGRIENSDCVKLHIKRLFVFIKCIIIVHNCTIIMSEFEKKHLELELKQFTSRNFVRPAECRNLDQIRFYIQELCLKIEDYRKRFNYVPNAAYTLLSQYNSRQNSLIYRDFSRNY